MRTNVTSSFMVARNLDASGFSDTRGLKIYQHLLVLLKMEKVIYTLSPPRETIYVNCSCENNDQNTCNSRVEENVRVDCCIFAATLLVHSCLSFQGSVHTLLTSSLSFMVLICINFVDDYR